MRLTLLGTGNAAATACYNTCFLLSKEETGEHFLIDGGGGNGLLRQLAAVNVSWKDIRDIFLTHKHIDHLLGVIWMLRFTMQNMHRGNYEGEVRLYAHTELVELLKTQAALLLSPKETRFIGDRFHFIALEDGDAHTILGSRVQFFDIGSDKARQFGFAMDLASGGRLCCCGDEPYSERERPYAYKSKWLLHEAFCLHAQADIFKPYEKNHSTVKDACELAESLGVENLILYHTEDKNIRERKRLYTEEGARYFRGNLYVPDDLESFTL